MNLLRAFGAVSSMTLVSRILGFARDLLIARMFGAHAPIAQSIETLLGAGRLEICYVIL